MAEQTKSKSSKHTLSNISFVSFANLNPFKVEIEMSVRKKMRTGDDTTSYSRFFKGLNEDLDHTPRKMTKQDHVVFSDEAEDEADPFGYRRNAVQRVFASTPIPRWRKFNHV